MWRVFPIFEAPVVKSIDGTNFRVPYFIVPYATNVGPYVLAVNDDSIIVGTYIREVNNAGIPRPFVWLPTGQYGLTRGFHDLLELVGDVPEDEPGYANDITDDGLIVGGRGDVHEGYDLFAFAWSLPDYGTASFSVPLDTINNNDDSWSMAIAVEKSGGASPRIVGLAGQPDCVSNWFAAEFDVGSTSPTIYDGLQQPPDDVPNSAPDYSHMMHFTDVAASEEPVLNYEAPLLEDLDTCDPDHRNTNECDIPFVVGAQLRVGNPPTWLRYGSTPPNTPAEERRITAARGISTDGLTVGTKTNYINYTNCLVLPAHWDNPGGGTFEASAPELPLPSPATEANVEGLNLPQECPARRLVGWSIDQDNTIDDERAIVWDQCIDGDPDPTEFECVYMVDSLDANPVSIVNLAYDVSEMGVLAVVVTGYGYVGPEEDCAQGVFAGLIVHRSDLNADLAVDGADLAIVFGAWGATTSTDPCGVSIGDVDGNGSVGSIDYAILLGDWSSGPVYPVWPCSQNGCEEARAAAPDWTNADFSVAFAALGFGGVDDFVAWGREATIDQLNGVCESIRAIMLAQE